MKVEVHNNNIGRAIRILNKKLKEENFWNEWRSHQYYEKPSVKRRRKKIQKQRIVGS